MGITISHKIGIADKNNVKKILDRAEQVAGAYQKEAGRLGISFEIRRQDDATLLIDIGHCETLGLSFKSARDIKKLKQDADGFLYEWEVLTDGGKKELDEGYAIDTYPQNEMFYSVDFCKTQFCGDLWEHKAVAELVRVVASRANYAEISDEGDYYYTGDIMDAQKAIAENGALINSIVGKLKGEGWKEENIITNKNTF